MLDVGDKIPDLPLVLSSGSTTRLADHRGQWLVLYFYPKDSTPGCTTEGLDFNALLPKFRKLGAAVLGVSRDSLRSHQNFCTKQGFKFDLVSDADEALCNAFGVINRWGFNNDNLQSDDVLIELGSSHLVTEIFDRELNQWVFIDGMMNTLGAYLGSVGPLTLHEFFLFINQPNRRPHLNVVFYDPETNKEQTMPVDQCPKEFLSYRGWTKGFHTADRGPPKADVP